MGTRHRGIPSRGLSIPRQPEALRAGLCVTAHLDPGLWSSADPAEREAATSVCLACPALAPCRAWALSIRQADDPPGLVLGGLDHAQRAAIRQQAAAS
jgi:hypothetical protein